MIVQKGRDGLEVCDGETHRPLTDDDIARFPV